MIGAGLALGAVAIGDLVAGGLACEFRSLRRSVAGVCVAVIAFLAGSIYFGLEVEGLGWLLILVAGYSASWIFLRGVPNLTTGRAWLCVVVHGVFVLWILGWGAGVRGTGAFLGEWLETLPYPGVHHLSASEVTFAVGVALWLGPTANGVVRAVLSAAGADPGSSEQKLRGGRIIGILERWMIFGFMLGGAPTAAAILVSAKSILRFPELNEKASQDAGDGAGTPLNIVTEYLLLGSLVSWILALAPVALFLQV